MKPVIIIHWPEFEKSVAVKLDPQNLRTGNTKPTLLAMEKEWKNIFPNSPFNYSFLNESITWLYGQESKTAWLVNTATGITIFISCMGLFGLCMFTAKRKTKEIGIRKVLGASVLNISTMLSRDFIRLVIIALFIATPIAWYFMTQWLQGFAYRVSLSGWTFLLAGFIAISIAMLTISFKAIAAATANPAVSLRTE
ncbi:MAG: FtsX-like permease family protein [Puia sp.]